MMNLQNVHIQEVKALMIVQEDQVHQTNVQNVHTIKANTSHLQEKINADQILANVQRRLVLLMINQNVHIQNVMTLLLREMSVRAVHSMKQHQKEITTKEKAAMSGLLHLVEI
jgi:hypothetical protein